ncbi:NADPH:quinone reductase [Streptomyces albofaciens JCM 4342]|uniref:NADPH:quinone reductase n=1 Tax=Streptomyces albofaciens TaxID=66866 RepID=UPI001238D512|nr:NADPH:quinone reductase [Streptomyces albofaciens]KAA6212686.1 NADPH:quinone reductase [Streptomyces albofaciens JCM 4342]
MRAAWYEKRGPARKVFRVGELPTPEPGPGELRIRLAFSGINPGDVKKRQIRPGAATPDFPLVVPHSDGAGVVDAVGDGVPAAWVGRRAWCSYAQSYRPQGTAAQYTVVPEGCVGALPDGVPTEQGACLGIPGITAHRALFADGPVTGRTVVVAGALGSVGRAAAVLARRAGALVVGTVTRPDRLGELRELGVDRAVSTGKDVVDAVLALTGGRGADRIVEVAFDTDADLDARLLAPGGTIAAYATGDPAPALPFWPLAFKNATVRLLGYDDFPREAVRLALPDITAAAAAAALRYPVAAVLPLDAVAEAHEAVEHPTRPGRVLLALPG